jgi:hypothetical protein
MGQAEQDRQNGTGRTGQAERDRQNFFLRCSMEKIEKLASKSGFSIFQNLLLVKTKKLFHQMGSNLLHSNFT